LVADDQAHPPESWALARGTKWSMSSELGSVTYVPVNAAYHCPLATEHPEELRPVVVRDSRIRTSWRVLMQSLSSSDHPEPQSSRS
jgi:hypothetical protein